MPKYTRIKREKSKKIQALRMWRLRRIQQILHQQQIMKEMLLRAVLTRVAEVASQAQMQQQQQQQQEEEQQVCFRKSTGILILLIVLPTTLTSIGKFRKTMRSFSVKLPRQPNNNAAPLSSITCRWPVSTSNRRLGGTRS